MKQLLRSALFLLIFALVFSFVQMTLIPKWGEEDALSHEMVNEKSFYLEPKHSLDAMFFGSVSVSSGISPLTMYDEYGFTAYVRSSTRQPPYFTFYQMKDSLRLQQPGVFVLEMGQFFDSGDPLKDEEAARRAMDYMRLSRVKLEAVSHLDTESPGQAWLSYLFPFFRYHDRWHDLTVSDFSFYDTSPYSYLKGQLSETRALTAEFPKSLMDGFATDLPLPPGNLRIFEDIVSLCEAEGIELCLLKTPSLDWDWSRHQSIQALADRYGLDFLDYNLPELLTETGIALEKDLSGEGLALCMSGADKLSRHLGAYLQATYALPDHRQEKQFRQWDEDLSQFLDLSLQNKAISLAIPVIVSASTDKNGITVSWEGVPHALAYAVYRKGTEADAKWVRMIDVPGFSYLDETPEDGEDYFYTVKAVRGSKTGSGDSTGIRITSSDTPKTVYMVDQLPVPEPEKPKEKAPAPVLLEVRPNADGIVFLWEAVEDADSYDVYRRAEGETDFVRVGKMFSPGFCDVSVQPGVVYTYTVKAIVDGRASDWDEQGLTIGF